MKNFTNADQNQIRNIPKDWDTANLGEREIFEVIMGQSPPSSTYNKENHGLPFLQGKMEFGEIFPSPLLYCSKPIKIAEKNDILISVRAPVGDVNISPLKLCIGRGLASIRCNPQKISYLFLFYFMKYKSKKFENISSGSTFKAIRRNELDNFEILLPSPNEQRKIAEVLSTVDQAIEKVGEAIKKTQRLKKGLMQELLTKGIGHREYKEIEIGKIPKEWEVIKIAEICKVKRGASPRPIGDPSYFSDKGRGWIRISDVTDTYKYLRKTSQYLSKKGEERSVKVNPGDLIMSIYATIGKPIILDMDACIHDGFVWFSELSTDIDIEYLYYVLQKNESTFSSKRQTGTQGNINTTLVGKTHFPLPPLPEQQKIAEILSTVDKRMELLREKKERFERIKKGLMDELLTGDRRVTI